MSERMRLTPMDAMFVLGETRYSPLHIGSLHTFKIPEAAAPHYVSELYGYLRSFPVSAPPFNYQLAGGLAGKVIPSWEILEDVDLDYHLRFSALPYPGGERELGILVSRLHSVPMDMGRPLWEMYLIEGLDGGRFAIYFKIHHALVDGTSFMNMIGHMTDPPGGFAPPLWATPGLVKEQPSEEVQAGIVERLTRVVRRELEALPSLGQGITTTAKAALGLDDESGLASPGQAPRSMLNVRIGAQRRVATYRVRLSRIKAIAKAGGGTVNDVVVAAAGGALRRYLLEQGELPAESLIAAVPVALYRDERKGPGNAVTQLMARMGTNLADPRERLELVKRSSEAGKRHIKGMTEVAAMNYTMLLATPLMLNAFAPGLGTLAPPVFNVIVSNVPGPREKLYFYGAEMESFYPVSQMGQGQALNITLLSYAGDVFFGFIGCRKAIPSLQHLAVYMEEAVDELEAAFVKPVAKPAASKKTPSVRKKGQASKARTRRTRTLRA